MVRPEAVADVFLAPLPLDRLGSTADAGSTALSAMGCCRCHEADSEIFVGAPPLYDDSLAV